MAYASWSVVFGEQPSTAKWNILGTNDASFNDGTGIATNAITSAKIANGSILPNHLITSSSTLNTWGWDTYTPTFANTTLGNGTVSGKYIKIGKFVKFYASFKLGSTSAMGTNPTVTLPVTASATAFDTGTGDVRIGQVSFEDSGLASYDGLTTVVATSASATTAKIIALGTALTYLTPVGVTSTVPFTWGTGDMLRVNGTYESA